MVEAVLHVKVNWKFFDYSTAADSEQHLFLVWQDISKEYKVQPARDFEENFHNGIFP